MSQQLSLNQFPADPLEDIGPLTEGELSVGFSLYSGTQASFEAASRELLQQRPNIPHSEINVVRILPTKKSTLTSPSTSKSHIEQSYNQSILGSTINQHKLEQLPPKSDPYELVKLCRQGWTLSKGIAKKPVMAKIDPALVQQDINKFSERRGKANQINSQNPISFGHSERYEPAQWPSSDTVSLASGKKNSKNALDSPNPHYHYHREPIKGRAISFPREVRMPNERPRSPGPIYSLSRSTQAIYPHHSIPSLDCSGRGLSGSIYWDQFNLKSAGNYYHGQEAYLNHTTAPAALPSTTTLFPPKEDSKRTLSRKQQIEQNLNPITPLVHLRREGSAKGQREQEKTTSGYCHRTQNRGKKRTL